MTPDCFMTSGQPSVRGSRCLQSTDCVPSRRLRALEKLWAELPEASQQPPAKGKEAEALLDSCYAGTAHSLAKSRIAEEGLKRLD